MDRAAVRVRLLGGFKVVVGDRELPDGSWRLRKAKSLIKLLALSPDRRLGRERISELLWPDHEPTAAANSYRYTDTDANDTADDDSHD